MISGVSIRPPTQHENYTRCAACPDGWPHDIALMYLERPVEFNEYVQPMTLASPENDEVYEEASCFVSGWGLLREWRTGTLLMYMHMYACTSNDDIFCCCFFVLSGRVAF